MYLGYDHVSTQTPLVDLCLGRRPTVYIQSMDLWRPRARNETPELRPANKRTERSGFVEISPLMQGPHHGEEETDRHGGAARSNESGPARTSLHNCSDALAFGVDHGRIDEPCEGYNTCHLPGLSLECFAATGEIL